MSASYAFGDGGDAARRLAVPHRVFVPLAERLLDDVVHEPDAGALPVGRADVVDARCLLAHLPDVAGAIGIWSEWLAPNGRLVLEEPERIDTDDPLFSRYLAATARAVAARGATMLAGPLVGEAAAELDHVVVDRVVAHPVVASDAATMFALNLTTIRRSDHRSGTITWHVRQVAIARSLRHGAALDARPRQRVDE